MKLKEVVKKMALKTIFYIIDNKFSTRVGIVKNTHLEGHIEQHMYRKIKLIHLVVHCQTHYLISSIKGTESVFFLDMK